MSAPSLALAGTASETGATKSGACFYVAPQRPAALSCAAFAASPSNLFPRIYCTKLELPLHIYGDVANDYQVYKIGLATTADRRELNGGCVKYYGGCVCVRLRASIRSDSPLPPRSREFIHCNFKTELEPDMPYTDSSLDLVLDKLAEVLEKSLLAKLEKYSMKEALYACHRLEAERKIVNGFTECVCLPKHVYALVEDIYKKHMPNWLRNNRALLSLWQSQLERDRKARIPAMETELCNYVLHDLTPNALAAPAPNLLVAVWDHKLVKEADFGRSRPKDAFYEAIQCLKRAAVELSKDPFSKFLPVGPVAQGISTLHLRVPQNEEQLSEDIRLSFLKNAPAWTSTLRKIRREERNREKAAKGGRAKALLRGSASTPGGLPPQSSRDPLQPRASHGCTLPPRPRAAYPRASDGALPHAFAGLTVSRLSGGAPHVPGMIRQPRSSNSGASQRASTTTLALHRTGAAGGQVAVLHAF